MEQYWNGFFAGLLFFCAILNLLSAIHCRRKINKVDELLKKTQKINNQLIQATEKNKR